MLSVILFQQAWVHGSKHGEIIKYNAGKSFSEEIVRKARQEMDRVCYILEQEGITVRRPEPVDFSIEFVTPSFRSNG